jgi:hypothetical protein
MMHCGFEGSAILEAMHKPGAFIELAARSVIPGRHIRGFGRGSKGGLEKEKTAQEQQPVA